MRQHKHLSLLGLWVENCLGRVLAQLGLMAALEIIVFGARLYLLPERPMEEVLKGVPSLFMAGWIALFHLLAHCGDERRAVGCTLRRLRVSEGAALAWKGLFGAACFLLLWVVQTAVCLGMGLWYAAAVGPAYRSAQTVLLAFYRVPFLHSLLPLAETAECMEKLREDGLIRAWGVSNLDLDDMDELAAVPGGKNCVTDQVLYHLGSRGIEFDLLPALQERDISVMAYCPLAQGGSLRRGLLESPAVADTARAHDASPAEAKERHIMGSCENTIFTFPERYRNFTPEQIRLSVAQVDGRPQVVADIHMEQVPLRTLTGMVSELVEITRNYDKIHHRNKKKDDAHLNKHAMHLVRLYLMCLDILEKEEIVTYREADHDLLMDIRNRHYQKADHTFSAEFYDLLNGLEKRLDYAKKNTSLPEEPGLAQIEAFQIEVNEKVVRDEF